MATVNPEEAVSLVCKDRIATITLNIEKKLNALTQPLYYRLAQCLREVAAKPDIYITILTAKGRFFSAGADVSISRALPEGTDVYLHTLQNFVAYNLNIANAFYTHPKILITALNGPAVGVSAALIGFSDFIYAAPHAFLLTPFSSLGLVAEGGASRGFVQRLGIAKANEALIMSKRITCEELVQTGFVNKVFDVKPGDTDKFMKMVLEEVDERLGTHLNQDSVLKIKALIRKPEREILDAANVAEVFGGLEVFKAGIPQKEFEKLAKGQKRHKL